MVSSRLFTFLLLSIAISLTNGASEDDLVRQLTNPGRYNSKVRPNGVRPMIVTVNVYIRSIDYVDDSKGEYRMQATLRAQYKDDRFNVSDPGSFPPLGYVTVTDASLVWIPDLFFSNERSGFRHDILRSNDLIRIHPNGDVLYSTRISVVLSCPMDLTNFPHDTQSCPVKIASYAYTNNDVTLQWNIDSPIQLNPKIQLPLFVVDKAETMATNLSTTMTGSYSTLSMVVTLSRKSFTHYWSKVYIPTTTMVFLAWLSLCIRDSKARYLVSIATILFAFTNVNLLNLHALPVTSYTKGVDTWTGTCLTFCLATLIVLILADNSNAKSSQDRRRRNALLMEDMPGGQPKPTGSSGRASGRQPDDEGIVEDFGSRRGQPSTAATILSIARFVYPIAFMIFTLLYVITRFL